jgi:hypothetical protein
MPRLTARALPVVAVAFLLSVPSAQAAQRWASPTSTVTSGACPQSAPCRIDAAVNGAASGDEVMVAPGTYSVDQLLSPTVPIDLHGVAGQERPRLVGASNLTAAMLSFKTGGTLRHLSLEATATGQDALTLQRGLGEDLLIISASGDGGKVVGATPATVLRDSVVRTSGTTSTSAGLKLRESGGAGDVALVNVTVMAPGSGATGVFCEVRNGQARIVNTIVRGDAVDITTSRTVGHCTATTSNFRPAVSPGLTSGAGNQSAEPRFVDAPAGDYRPVPGSPTIDAGQADALLGTADPSGCSRTLGAAADIGAYEYAADDDCASAEGELTGAGRAGDSGLDADLREELAGVPAPALGTTVVTAPGKGKIRIRRPGESRYTALGKAARIPVGSTIDATAGRLRLVSAIDAAGTLQAGTFWGSRFKVRQERRGDGTTILVLRGGNFGICRSRSTRRLATVSRKRKPKTVRSLWAKDRHGRFRTQGANSVATARGTSWLTRDRCDGTLTRVTAGAVSVRDRGASKSVLVKAGRSHLARHRH